QTWVNVIPTFAERMVGIPFFHLSNDSTCKFRHSLKGFRPSFSLRSSDVGMTFFILLQGCHSMKNFPGLNATWYHNKIKKQADHGP
ncbi:hypothetical protein KKC82_03380, partial [bacterium]|nr:hypothetical protein [bacterium]